MKKTTKLKAALLLAVVVNSSYAEEKCFPPVEEIPTLPEVLECFQKQVDELKSENKTQQDEIQALKLRLDLKDGLVAHYSFDGDANDVSGHGHDGTVKGATLTVDRFGNLNSAYSFDGSSKIVVNSLKGFHWRNKFSVSVWFKRTGQWSNYQGIVNNGYYQNGSWEIRMGRENNGTMLGGGVVTATSPKTWDYINLYASQNQWHHVVMTYNGFNLSFYLDGVAQSGEGNDSGEITAKNTPLTIGQAGIGMEREYFFGSVDEVRIYNRALTTLEIKALYK